ncbi:MAG: hypothetical protein IKN82_07815 [Treponema sp.]|nr:hypothetical protein [Treponema sp.]
MFDLPLFAETYYWAGGGADANWTTAENWRTGSEAGTVAAAYPTSGDTAFIAGDYTVTIDADITVAALNIKKSGDTQYVGTDWTTKFTGSKKLSFGAMDFNRASSTGGVIGTLEIDCDSDCTGTLYTHSGTKLLIDGGNKLTTATLTHTATNSIPKSLIQVDGTLQAGAIDLQGGLNVGCNALKVSSGATVTATSLTWSANDNYTNTDYPAIDNAGTITLSGNLNATGPASNTGTLKTTGGTLTFKSSVANTGTISATTGGVTFAGAVTGAGGTISTTTGNITASAAAASSLGTVQSSGGTISNTGSGAVTLAELQMGADTSVTNSTGGALAITKLTGNRAAMLTGGTNDITVSSFDGSPTIAVAAGSCALGTGTIAALTVDASAEAAIAGSLTVTGATTNAGTISVGANSITFAGAVSSASGTVTMTTGGVTVSGAAASAFGSVQCAGGAFTNSGSGATTVADFAMSDNSVVTNSAGGTLTMTKLSGAYNATIKSVSADNGITVNSYDAATKITVAASSKNILLASGTLDRLAISGGAKATISGDMTTTSGITNNGTLATSAALLINGAVTNGGTIEAAANDITFNGAATNTGTISATTGDVTFAGAVAGASGTISTTTGNITTSAAAASSLGTVQTTSGSLTNSGAGNVAVADFAPVAATSVTNTAAGSIALAKITSAAATSLSGDIKAASYSDGLPIIVNAATGTSANNVDLGAGKPGSIAINAGGKASILGDIETSGGITNAGTLDASAAKITMTGASVTLTGNATAANTKIKDFVYAPTDTTETGLAVAGSNTFTNFTCQTGGAKITFSGANNAAQTVTTLALAGTSASPLTVTGTGSIALESNQNTGDYLSVAYNGVSIDGKFYSAKNSTFDAAPYYGERNHWILLNDSMGFVWTGATDTDWGKPSNWNYNLIPGTEKEHDGVNTKTYPVKIPDSPSGARYPIAAKSYTIKDLQIGETPLSSVSSASLTLNIGASESDRDIKTSGTLTNYGTIYYTGTDRITNGTAFINDADIDHKGTVVFSTGSAAADLANVAYYNLIVSGNGAFSTTAGNTLTVKNDMTYSGDGSLTVNDAANISNDLTISGSGTFTANAALTVTNALAVSDGNVFFNNGAGDTTTSAATAAFTTAGTVSLGNSAGDSFTVTGGALDLPNSLGALSLAGTITAGGTGVTIGHHNAVLNANTNFASDTKTSGNVTLSGSFTVTNAAAASLDTSAGVLTLENANLVNTGAVTNGNIKFTGTTDQTFTPNEASTYDSVAIDKASNGSVTVDKAITSKNLAIHQAAGKNATFGKKATVSDSFTDTSNAGNILFNAGCDFTPAATFNTTGTLTLNGATNACNFTDGLTHTAGLTSLYGTLNTANAAITLGDTTLNDNTTIGAGSGAVTIQGALETLNGAQSLVSSGTGMVIFDGTVGASNPPSRITTAGSATFNAATKVSGPVAVTGDGEFNAATNVAGDIAIDGNASINGVTATTGSGKIAIGGNASINAATASASTITVNGATNVGGPSISSGGLQLYKDNLTFSAPCAVTGTVQAAANVATSGAHSVTFANDLWLYTSAAAALGGSGGSLSVAENLYFAGASKNAAVESNVTAKNVLLLHGTVDIGSAATLASSSGDIILLGADYDIDDDKYGAAASQVTGLFAYKHASRKRAASYTDPFPTACPDGTTISQPWSGAVTTNAGAKISAGQNFYANGLSSLGSGAWTLLLKDNNLQTSAFAEIYNSTISNCTASPIGGSGTVYLAAAEHNTVTACSNIITARPMIKEAWTVYDDAIYISFKDSNGADIFVENSCNEISAAASRIFNSVGGYAATYTDADCQHSTDGAGDLKAFYIKSNNKWKTDASGITAGSAESSNRAGDNSCATIPYLNIPKALAAVYETLRDSSKNRIAHYYSETPDTSAASAVAGKTFTAVVDKCAPVLIQVLTGQELHGSPGSQAPYDAHNFIEFVYSEPVDISGGVTSVLPSDTNIQAQNDLGATTSSGGEIVFAGLATTSGKIEAALKTGSGSPHALYRNFSTSAAAAAQDQPCRIRVSIAGYTDGAFDAQNQNWPGYVSSAISPVGTVTRMSNANIKDKAAAQNSQDINSTSGHALPTLIVQNSANELYGSWDVTPPSFAPVRINGTHRWVRPATDGSQEYEFVGASYGTGTLSAIELHWFDNEPSYTENLQWFSRVGWANASSATEHSIVENYAADVRGGSRPDASGNTTAGGIRFCTLRDSNGAFKYSVEGTEAWHSFSQQIQAGAESSLFAYAGDTSGLPTHTTGAEDGLYCKLRLDETNYVLQTTFALEFDSSICYITDLAGNRIQCGKIKMKTIDRTPPAFNMSAVPLGTKNMLIIFSKALNTDSMLIYSDAAHSQSVPALEYIPKSLVLTNSSGTGIQIDQNIPAQCLFKNANSTGLLITLNQNAVLTDVASGVFVTAQSSGTMYDPLAGVTASVTYIQDAVGNYVVDQSKHAFSDFAVNAVLPQYAYDNSITDDGSATGFGLYQDGSWAVRDWNAEQANYGTLHAGKEIMLQVSLYDGTDNKSGGLAPSGQLASGTVTGFFANKPTPASVSTRINETTGMSWRIWQPNWTSDIFPSLAPANNSANIYIDGTANDAGVLFDIPKDAVTANWKSGDQISFLFKMGNYTVDHFANGTIEPLYAVRLKNPNDITSLDLWSFKIKETTLQRGGVSILNNVINVDYGENTVVQVDLKESGNLNVIVMTLDGNIVTYLRHGHTDAGTHYYKWNGTNNGGSKVARGLYFVRVIGPGIDETRKVMCVK